MIISACVIVKDDTELESFKKSVESYIDYVDEVNVVANGKNVKGIKNFCKDKGLNYYFKSWTDDFSDVRNFSFSKARKDTNFCFWMDSDDKLVGGEYLRDIAQTALDTHKDLVFLTYWYGCEFDDQGNMTQVTMQHPRERLIRPG
jgi:RimJ/RimL family protein N-acetyltransferase